MESVRIDLAPGKHRLDVLRFGPPGARPKVYIQGGLHADEAPGMAVAFALRDRLAALEAEGRLLGEVVLVPHANPIGRDQVSKQRASGRFHAPTGQNFNRAFPDAAALALAQDDTPPDALDAVAELRARMVAALQALPVATELQAMQRALLALAIDADIVLDMHCDSEALVYLFCHSEQAGDATALGRAAAAAAVLHAELQGGNSFDESCTLPWLALRRRWPQLNLPIACFAVTLEWRGQSDVDSTDCATDAEGLLCWLAEKGVIAGPLLAPPRTTVAATPLEAVEVVKAQRAGIFQNDITLGARVRAGDRLGQIIALSDGAATLVTAGTSGLVYARERSRLVEPGAELFFIAGERILRSGMLLSA